jgi:ATP-binding protein involved in chromosome partitioning
MSQLDEKAVLTALAKVEDPDLKRDIVSLGFVQNLVIESGRVAFDIELTTPACPMKNQLKSAAEQVVGELPGVSEVAINMTARVPAGQTAPVGKATMPGVKHVIPVASGKGGVGKSTVSANLAVALAASGARVGLLDADIYGPSIPMIMGINEKPEMADDKTMLPVEKYGVKVISMGFFIEAKQAVVWRGPMLGKMVDEFLDNVSWGELDYLIIDLPPGTGDVQLSLCQKLHLSGAVVVSTPQDVSLGIARKAISLFEILESPVLGLVENMSWYRCPHCGEREDIFGNGGTRRAAETLGLPFLGELPLAASIREDSDRGHPTVIADPDSVQGKAFKELAGAIAARISTVALAKTQA